MLNAAADGQNRVVGQIKNERDFHIFYQLTKAATQDMRSGSYLPKCTDR